MCFGSYNLFAIELSCLRLQYHMMVLKRTLRDAMDATIIGGTSATHLVRYADGGIDEVSSDSLHGAICELSVIDAREDVLAQGTALDYDEYDGDGISISLHVKTKDMVGKLTIGGRADEVQITGSQLGRALLAVEEEALTQPDIDTLGVTDQSRPISTRMEKDSTQSDTTHATRLTRRTWFFPTVWRVSSTEFTKMHSAHAYAKK